MNELFITRLQELPGQIEDKERTLIGIRNLIASDERSLKILEIQLKKEINNETIAVPVNVGGVAKTKQLFTNEKARENELYLRCSKDERHGSLEKSLEDRRGKISLLQIELARLNNDFKAYRAIALMVGVN